MSTTGTAPVKESGGRFGNPAIGAMSLALAVALITGALVAAIGLVGLIMADAAANTI